jgi:lipopolysaccharide transport system ATP-binding protein
VGDMEFQKKCIDKMTGFKKSGVTIVFVSHSMPDVKRICDRVAWIDNHTIKMIGSTDAVVLSYAKQ